ncbi:hypothetical protein M758_8G067700 [Ceratodon purpureus]|uniref:Uncharacterized protein n=1 Tax=Ceratodon purpureus TaxID=3225 RepID=A0A8T0GZU2_CERPU|nr:hypothetical protein KC19_8G071900 [Ceratodon purpureus]KAG0607970.1 hypothetical protein M758_8G067700 [Ceratodon purpureus]
MLWLCRCSLHWKRAPGEMVGAFTKFSCSRPSHRSKHHHFVDERIGGNRISPAIALHGVPALETFEAVEHPSEPVDVDQPARCPPPERSIMRDGLIWKEMLARRSEKAKARAWQGDATMVGLQQQQPWRRRILSSPREKYLFMTHSAPERIVS